MNKYEQFLQEQCEYYLKLQKVMHVHLRTFWQGRPVPGRKGWPDLFIFMGLGRTFFVELKVGKAKQRPSQIEVSTRLGLLGYAVYVIRTLDEFIELIELELKGGLK